MHENCLRVQEALRAIGIGSAVREFEVSARTAEEAAQAIGCRVAEIAKSLIFMAGDEAILVLVGGDERADLQKLTQIVGKQVYQPKGKEVKEITGFPIGGVPPLAHTNKLRTFVDSGLLAHKQIWAAAGTPNSVFPCTPQQLAEGIGAQVLELRAAH